MQTALHITALVAELKSEIVGGEFIAGEFYKKERAVYMFSKRKGRFVVGFSFHPTGAATWLAPASKLKLATREKPWPLFGIDSGRITAVEQLGIDRIFRIGIERDGVTSWLLFEAIGPNGNIWLLDGENSRQATLRKREFEVGAKYLPAPLPTRLDPFALDATQLADLLKRCESPTVVTCLEKNIFGFNRTLAKEAVARAGLDFVPPDEIDEGGIEALTNAIEQICGFFNRPEVGYLYETPGGF